MGRDERLTPFGPIPLDWALTPVGSAGQVQIGRARSPGTDFGPNMVPYLRVANVLDGYIDYSDVNAMHFSEADQKRYSLRRGDILLNEGQSTELVGRSAIYDGPEDAYCYQNSLVNFRCGSSVIPQFARAVFKRWLDIGHFTTILKQTTSMAHLGGARFASLQFPVPPLFEQLRIAEILDALDRAIRKTERLIAKLKQVKEGLTHDLLTRGIDDNGELRDSARHPEQFKNDVSLGLIPSAWDVRPFADLCESSAFGPRFPSDRYASEGPLATLRTTDMSDDGEIDLTTMPRASINPHDFGQHLLRKGDLVISRSGTCGVAGVFPGHQIPVVPGAFLIRFRTKDKIQAHLLRRYFNSPLGRPRLERLAVGGVQKNIKGSDVLSLRVPHLRPDEAERVVQLISDAERQISTESGELAKLRVVKQGVMEDLLTGRVRVTNLLNKVAA